MLNMGLLTKTKTARRKELEAAGAALARATSVTLTARGAGRKDTYRDGPGHVNPGAGRVCRHRGRVRRVGNGRESGERSDRAGQRLQHARRKVESSVPDVPRRPEGAFLYVSAQNGDEGCVSASIYIHGIETKSAHSCGDFKIRRSTHGTSRPSSWRTCARNSVFQSGQ